MSLIATVTRATVRTHKATGRTVAFIEWLDTQGRIGRTSGKPKAHLGIDALLAKASRQGVRIVSVTVWGG